MATSNGIDDETDARARGVQATDPRCKTMELVANECGKIVYRAIVCAVANERRKSPLGGRPPFDPNDGWESVATLQFPAKNQKIKRLLVVTSGSKTYLAALFGCLVQAVYEGGKLPADGVRTYLLNSVECRRAPEAQYVVRVAEAMAAKVAEGDLALEFGATRVLQSKLLALVASPDQVTPGSEALALLFVDFLKSVGWFVAQLLFAKEKEVLNIKTLRSVLRMAQALEGVGPAHSTFEYLDGQLALAAAPLAAPPPPVAQAGSRPDNVVTSEDAQEVTGALGTE